MSLDPATPNPAVEGQYDPALTGVAELFKKSLASREDIGASVAVVQDGELLVDLWGGAVDKAGTSWHADTIVNVFSVTKTMTALCALLLVDHGELDVDAPVARYWPEFAANGKTGVLVRHVLGHTAGLPGWDEPTSIEDLYDWDLVVGRLERQAPWWRPGSRSGYHGLTQGFLVGELVRRVGGATLGEFFASEIATPLGADFHIGLPAHADDRVALLIPPRAAVAPAMTAVVSKLAQRALSNPLLDPRVAATTAWRRAEIPAANGHGNARSIALAQSALCGALVNGRRMISSGTAELAFQTQAKGIDLVLGMPVEFGIGYARWRSSGRRRCYWTGVGGALVVIDVDLRVVVGYAMNRMVLGGPVDDRARAFVDAAFAVLEK